VTAATSKVASCEKELSDAKEAAKTRTADAKARSDSALADAKAKVAAADLLLGAVADLRAGRYDSALSKDVAEDWMRFFRNRSAPAPSDDPPAAELRMDGVELLGL